MTGAPVVPVGVWGTEQVWPRSARVPDFTGLWHPPTRARPRGRPRGPRPRRRRGRHARRSWTADHGVAPGRGPARRTSRRPRSWPAPSRPGARRRDGGGPPDRPPSPLGAGAPGWPGGPPSAWAAPRAGCSLGGGSVIGGRVGLVARPAPARRARRRAARGAGERDQRQDHHHHAAGRRPRRPGRGGHVGRRGQPSRRPGRRAGRRRRRAAGRARGGRGLPRARRRRPAPGGGGAPQPVARPARPGQRGAHGGGPLARRGRRRLRGCTVVANADDPLVAWAAQPAAQVVWVAAGQRWRADADGLSVVRGPAGVRRRRCRLVVHVRVPAARHPPSRSSPGGFVGDGATRAAGAVAPRAMQRVERRHGGRRRARPRCRPRSTRVAAMAGVGEVEGRFAVGRATPVCGRACCWPRTPPGGPSCSTWSTAAPPRSSSASTPASPTAMTRRGCGTCPSNAWRGRRVVATGERCRDLAVRLQPRRGRAPHRARPTARPGRRRARRTVEYAGNYTAFQALRRALARAGDGRRTRRRRRCRRGRRRGPRPWWPPAPSPTSITGAAGPKSSALRVVVVHPDLLGTYGDGGNGLVLAGRAAWRGIPVELVLAPSDRPLPEAGDVYCLGGGRGRPAGPGGRAAARRRAGPGRRGGGHGAGRVRRVPGGRHELPGCRRPAPPGCRACSTWSPTRVPGAGRWASCWPTPSAGPRRSGPRRVGRGRAASGLLTGFENHGARHPASGPGPRPWPWCAPGIGNGDG